jgi:D-aspartate ligase
MNHTRRWTQPVIVLELTPTGLSVARSLGSRGIPVYGVDPKRLEIGHFSKYVRNLSWLSYRRFDERLVEALVRLARSLPAKPVLFCGGDPSCEFASQFHEALRPHLAMVDSLRPEVSGIFVNKIEFYKRCHSLGIGLPATFFPQSIEEVKDIARGLAFPAIIKPAYSHLWRTALKGNKILEVASADELIRCYESYCTDEQRKQITIQEVIVGPETNIAIFTGYTNRNYELVNGFTARKSRQYPPFFGSASYAESCWMPEIVELSREALRALQYHGIAGTEYKYDTRRKEWLLIEINPRVVLWEAIARAAGTDIILDCYLDLIGELPIANLGGQRDGVRWQYLARDTGTVIQYVRHGWAPVRSLLNYFDPNKEFAVIDTEDPALIMMYPFYILSQMKRFISMGA